MVIHLRNGLARSVQERSPPITAATVARRNRGRSINRADAPHHAPQKTDSQIDHCTEKRVTDESGQPIFLSLRPPEAGGGRVRTQLSRVPQIRALALNSSSPV